MIRQIIKIDENKCDGCGICAAACHEGAIGIKNGKAVLLRDDYCDGLGDCLPACPKSAITFEKREALEFNAFEVKKNMDIKKENHSSSNSENNLPCGCPGSHSKAIQRNDTVKQEKAVKQETTSQLNQWPVQIKLVPIHADYFQNANLLVAADCCAYAYANFHNDFIKNKITLIGCPKLDNTDYAEKLLEIIKNNDIKSVTVARMQVPCCGGIEQAVIKALQSSGKMIPWQVITIATDGNICD